MFSPTTHCSHSHIHGLTSFIALLFRNGLTLTFKVHKLSPLAMTFCEEDRSQSFEVVPNNVLFSSWTCCRVGNLMGLLVNNQATWRTKMSNWSTTHKLGKVTIICGFHPIVLTHHYWININFGLCIGEFLKICYSHKQFKVFNFLLWWNNHVRESNPDQIGPTHYNTWWTWRNKQL